MAWQLVAPNQWKNDRSDFTIKFDEAYGNYIVESVDGRFSIPFDDIFNNPVFPIDLSQVTVLGKHFRAEGVNTPGTPGFSFQGDAKLGFYRVGENRMGFAANGIKQGEFGVGYGGFTGNLIQVVSSTNNHQTNISGIAFQNINSASGVVWETSITPKLANSKIFILFTLQLNPPSADYIGFRVSSKINAGSYSVIYNPQIASGFGAIDIGFSTSGGYVILTRPVLYTPTYSLRDTITHKIEGSCYNPSATGSVNTLRTGTGSNSGHSEMFLFEIAG